MPTTPPGFPLPIGRWARLYALVLVYVSFIPFEYRGLPAAEWGHRVLTLPWLELGPEHRADWIANLLLFIPFGGLLLEAALRRPPEQPPSPVVPLLLASMAVIALALAIEAVQPQFAPRTASRNDILAALLGGALGMGLWLAARRRGLATLAAARHPGRRGLLALLTLYALVYLLAALFPFDFVASPEELATRWRSVSLGLFAGSGAESPARGVARLLVELTAVAPLGAALCLHARSAGRRWRPGPTFAIGLALGLVIEGLQLLMLSGMAQGVSLLTRPLGMVLGGWLLGHLWDLPLPDLQRRARLAAALLLPLYGLAAIWLTGLPGAGWRSPAAAFGALEGLRFIPFYYHYFTTEAAAARSLFQQLALYAPCGALAWCWLHHRPGGARTAALAAGLLALLIEGAKLFTESLRPDPSNLLIAAAAAWAAYAALAWLARAHPDQPPAAPAAPSGSVPGATAEARTRHETDTESTPGSLSPARLVALVALAVTLAGALSWPTAAAALTVVLLAYLAWLYRDPRAWILVLPAAAPLLNWMPVTGQMLFSELDLLLGATVAGALWHPRRRSRARLGGTGRLGLGLLLLASAVALLVALWPPALPDATGLARYQGPLAPLLVAKAFLWALVLHGLLQRGAAQHGEGTLSRLLKGMTAGLGLVAGVIIWERAVYAGVFAFDVPYRVTGPFNDMHVGGPTVEAYLVMTLPFAAAGAVLLRGLAARTAAAAIVALGLYALLVTYARAGQVAGLVALVTVALGFYGIHRYRARLPRYAAVAAGLAVPVIAVAGLLTLPDGYLKERLERSRGDAEARLDHWSRALSRAQGGTFGWVFGNGLGTVPRLYAQDRLEAREPLPANFAHVTEGGGARLRLGPGQRTYLAQRIDVSAAGRVEARIRARTPEGEPARLGLYVCETHLLTSVRCRTATLAIEAGDGRWQTLATSLDVAPLGKGFYPLRRGVSFSVAHLDGAPLELDAVGLQAGGAPLLRNGDWRNGLAHWYYVVDDYADWRLENQYLALFIERGLLGVLGFALLVLAALKETAARLARNETHAIPLLGATVGLLVLGVVATVWWSPVVQILSLWLLLIAARRTRSHQGRSAAPESSTGSRSTPESC